MARSLGARGLLGPLLITQRRYHLGTMLAIEVEGFDELGGHGVLDLVRLSRITARS